jgi:hypothetical protein
MALMPTFTDVLTIPITGHWVTHNQFEAIIRQSPIGEALFEGRRLRFTFSYESNLLAGVGLRLLSLLNQLASLPAGVELEFAGSGGLYSYLNRSGFFDFLDPRIETIPERPVYSYADLYRGNTGNLVEIAQLTPGVSGSALYAVVDPLTEALSRLYARGPRYKHLRASAYAALGELVDNVYSHSETTLPGFAMLQAYVGRARPTVHIAVSDSGIGIPTSLRVNLKGQVRGLADHEIIVRAFEGGLSRKGGDSGRSCGLPRCAQLASEFDSTVWVRTRGAHLALSRADNTGDLNASYRVPSPILEGSHVCIEFPLRPA